MFFKEKEKARQRKYFFLLVQYSLWKEEVDMSQVYIRIINLEKRGENVKGGRMSRVNFHIVHIVAEINGFDFLKRSHFFFHS